MMIAAWRITKTIHVPTAMSGEGARLCGGRWNLIDTPVVYMSSTLALAAWESFVHLHDEELDDDYSMISVAIPESMIWRPKPDELPSGWHFAVTSGTVQEFGSAWCVSRRSCVLRVPSAVIPGEFNYLISPSHPDFHKINIAKHLPFAFDRRLKKS